MFYFESNVNEIFNPKNIGFALTSAESFTRFSDPNNCNIHYIVNESQKEKVEKSLVENGVMSTIYSFYEEFFEADTPLNLNNSSFLIFVPYLTNAHYTSSLNLNLQEDYYLDMIKFPNLYIIPEKLIINEKVPELLNFQLRKLSTVFISNFIGGLIHEKSFTDFWILAGLEGWLTYCFMQKCNGNLYVKNLFLEKMKIYKNYVSNGLEKRPLYSNNYTHPVELQTCPIIYLKSFLVILLLENFVERVFLQKAIKNFINERHKENGEKGFSTELLLKTLQKNCGVSLKKFLNLWIFKTGILNLKLFYRYIEDNNSIDVELYQIPELYEYATEFPLLNIDKENEKVKNSKNTTILNSNNINSNIANSNTKELNYDTLRKIGKIPPVVDFSAKANRYFDVDLVVNIYQTNGFEVLKETHQVVLESEKDCVIRNFPLITKLRKCPIKKREQEFIQELISNTNITKIYSNDEIEKILTKHSVLWLRVDPELMCLRTVLEVSKEDILLEYIKLFKDPELTGQYESLQNIYYNTKNNNKTTSSGLNNNNNNSSEGINKLPTPLTKHKDVYNNSLIILETFIKTNQEIYFKLRIYALEIYVKMVIEMKQEEGYLFLIELLDDYSNLLIKEKTVLNREVYLLMKSVIKLLGEYNEEQFSDFNIIGKVKISQIQNRIIDRFLLLLLSSEFNTISGLDDCYILREIIIGCSKLYLQEKTVYLLRKILQLLRIEKLKRSYNEIVIISCMEAYLNCLFKNNFFKNEIKEDSYIEQLVKMINEEINYFIESWVQRIELSVYNYYYILIFLMCKENSIAGFIHQVKKFIGIEEINSIADNDEEISSDLKLVRDFIFNKSTSTRNVSNKNPNNKKSLKISTNLNNSNTNYNNTSTNNTINSESKEIFNNKLDVEMLSCKLTALQFIFKNAFEYIVKLINHSNTQESKIEGIMNLTNTDTTHHIEDKDKENHNNSTFKYSNNPIVISFLKQLLSSRFLYYRIDLRIAFTEILDMYSDETKEEYKSRKSIYQQNEMILDSLKLNLNGNGNGNGNTYKSINDDFFNSIFPKNKSNDKKQSLINSLDFSSFKIADDIWLQEYINNEQQENKNLVNKNKNGNYDNNSEESSNYNVNANNQHYLLKRYQLKYRDQFVLSNYNLELEKYSMYDAMLLIVNKMLEHEYAENFDYPLNEENLVELYEGYMKIISHPMDLDTIKNKILNREYSKFSEFVSDIRLVFSNCREFNEKKSFLYQCGNQLEEFFNILIEPIKKKNFDIENPAFKLNLADLNNEDFNGNNAGTNLMFQVPQHKSSINNITNNAKARKFDLDSMSSVGVNNTLKNKRKESNNNMSETESYYNKSNYRSRKHIEEDESEQIGNIEEERDSIFNDVEYNNDDIESHGNDISRNDTNTFNNTDIKRKTKNNYFDDQSLDDSNEEDEDDFTKNITSQYGHNKENMLDDE